MRPLITERALKDRVGDTGPVSPAFGAPEKTGAVSHFIVIELLQPTLRRRV